MKKIFLLLVAMVAVSGMCLAQSGSCGDNLNWSYDGAGTLTITGTGEMTDFAYMANEPWYSFQADITSVSLPNGITRIGEHAFYNCSNLATINLPSGLLTIGNGAFDHTALTAVVLPEGVTTLGMNAFNYCQSLVSVTIPTSVTDLSRQAFWNCILLADVTVHWTTNDALPTLGIDVFRNIKANAKLHVPYGTTSLYSAAAQWSSFNIVEMNPSGQCGDNLFWEYNPSTYTLTITGTGDMWDWYDASDVPWHSYTSEITTVVLPNGLTTIGKLAFYDCYELTSITIPAGVTTIGNSAFYSCLKLTSVTIPEGVTTINRLAFADCQALTSIEIPATVTTIGAIAFATDDNLASVTVNWTDLSGVTTAANAFSEIASGATLHVPCGTKSAYEATEPWSGFTIDDPCPSGQCGDNLYWLYNSDTHVLTITGTGDMWDWYDAPDVPWHSYTSEITTVVLPDGVTSIGGYAFKNCTSLESIDIPSGVTVLKFGAFDTCTNLSSVTLPEGLTTINNGVFAGCSSLASINIPASVTYIGMKAFYGCSSLASITIPSGVMIIKEQTFYGCSNLSSITIPNTVTEIERDAFRGCSNLSSIAIPSGVTSIGPNAFEGCSSLESIVIPSGVTAISVYAFRDCSSLKTVDIPSGVTSIGNSAFDGCSSLESIVIPSGVPSIGISTFEGCSSLESITIPSGVTEIKSYAFRDCSSLKTIDIPSGVTAIGTYAFRNCTGLTDVTVHWTDLTGVTTNANVFRDVTTSAVNLHLPFAAWESYEATAPWSGFKQVPVVTAKEDPNNANTYYNTFYHSSVAYEVPAGVEAYTAQRDGTDLILTKIAQAGDVLPAGTAVILKSSVASYEMTPSEETPVTVGENDLLGKDASETAPSNCYVLSGPNPSNPDITEVGFYTFSGTLGAHKAYLVIPGSNPAPPRHLRFVFDSAMDIEQPTSDSSLKGGEKILLDGVLYIERGEHLYNAQGVRVK